MSQLKIKDSASGGVAVSPNNNEVPAPDPREKEFHVASGDVDYESPLISSLCTVMGLMGRSVSMEVLKSGLPQGKDPVSPATCIRAAENAGVRAKLVHRKKISQISRLILPVILILDQGNAAVLVGYDKENARVIFPETGGEVHEVPLETLQEEYAGYAIFTKPKGKLDRRASELKLLKTKKWFWGTIFRFLPIYKHVVLASLIINMLALASSLFTMNVYDRVVPNNAVETLWVMAVGVFIAFGFDFVLKNLRSYFVDVAGKNADILIASKLMHHVMAMKLEHKPESTGSLANNLREFESLREFFSSTTLLGLLDLPFLVIFLFVIYLLGGPLVYVPMVAIPVVIISGILFQFPFQRVVETGYKEMTQKNAFLVEVINGIETVKSTCAEGSMQQRWEEIVGMNAASSGKAKLLANLSINFSQLVSQMVSVGIVVFGVFQIGAGEMTVGGLIACNILLGRAMAPLAAIAAMLSRLQRSRMALKSLDLIMETPTERPEGMEYVSHQELDSSMTFQQVNFTYPSAQTDALKNVSLHIRPGEKVGVIGRIGSGKSTLGKLGLGLYPPGDGMVRIGGIDIRQLDIADVRKKIGYVSQDNYLFYGSVRDNITLGMPYSDDRAILRAADIAGVTDFVRTHPAGFGLQVGERGMNLSGGQRQAVAVARALVHDPDILILDEPSSNMDNLSEQFFKQRLQAVLGDKTLVLVTHKQSFLSLVDRLVVMDSGIVVADGPKDKVLEALKNNQVNMPANYS